MAITANFSSQTGVLSLVGGERGSGADRRLGAGGRLGWRLGGGSAVRGGGADPDTRPVNGGLGFDAFTVTANAGQVRVFRAFLDRPQARPQRKGRAQRKSRAVG